MSPTKFRSVKEQVISFLNELPEDVTFEEIMYHLYVKQKILKGKKELKRGNTNSQEKIEDEVKKW